MSNNSVKVIKLPVFFMKDECSIYDFEDDSAKVLKYHKEHGYGFLLTYSSMLKKLVNNLNAFKGLINLLEEWKSHEWFKPSETTYKLMGNTCSKEYDNKEYTLKQATDIYNELYMKYQLLISLIDETYRIHSENIEKEPYDINEFRSEFQIGE